ncbi:MAG: site-specific integrase [Candidatus Omnitrophota bacterium]
MPVYEYKGKKGIIYYIVYSYNGRRKTEHIGKDKKLAEAVLHKRLTEIAENKYLDVRKEQKIKFEEFADEYLQLHSKHKRSYNTDKKIVGLLKSFFGGKYLYEITSLDVERFKSARAKQVIKRAIAKKTISPATVNRALAVLKSIFNKAILWGKSEKNPCKGVELFKEDNQRLRFLEKEEIDRLLSNCCEHLKPIIIVALYTGMRKSEILKLKWHDIDIKRNIIHLLTTKNGEKREVPMNRIVQKTIIGVLKHPDSQYIFCNKDGKPYGDIKKSFFTAINNSGIVDFHFHDLRHTFASQLVMSGVDLNTVRELLGHKSLEMTLRYSHLSPDHKKRAVDVLEQNLHKTEPQTAGNLQEISNFENKRFLTLSELIDNKQVGI